MNPHRSFFLILICHNKIYYHIQFAIWKFLYFKIIFILSSLIIYVIAVSCMSMFHETCPQTIFPFLDLPHPFSWTPTRC